MSHDAELDEMVARVSARQDQERAHRKRLNEVQHQLEQAQRRSWTDFLELATNCALRLGSAGVPTKPILMQRGSTFGGTATYEPTGQSGWSVRPDDGYFEPDYSLSIDTDGQFGLTAVHHQLPPRWQGEAIVWNSHSQDPPADRDWHHSSTFAFDGSMVALSALDHYERRKVFDARKELMRGTASLLIRHTAG